MVKVEIHYWDKKKIPFGTIVSRYAIALILGYYSSSEDVLDLMQRTSHLTRVYFINEDRLEGFLISKEGIISSIQKDLPHYEKLGRSSGVEFQNIDMRKILQILRGLLNDQRRLEYLGERYPYLLIEFLERRREKCDLIEYIENWFDEHIANNKKYA